MDPSLLLSNSAAPLGSVLRLPPTPPPSPASAAARKKLYIAGGLCVVFMIAEAVGGFYANSLAILTE